MAMSIEKLFHCSDTLIQHIFTGSFAKYIDPAELMQWKRVFGHRRHPCEISFTVCRVEDKKKKKQIDFCIYGFGRREDWASFQAAGCQPVLHESWWRLSIYLSI